jgi:release factor glutamine methyltransferase
MFDCIVSNPPYVSLDEHERLNPNVRNFEPPLALTGLDNADGFGYARRIIENIYGILAPSGFTMIETNERVGTIRDDLTKRAARYAEFDLMKDYSGKERFILLRK